MSAPTIPDDPLQRLYKSQVDDMRAKIASGEIKPMDEAMREIKARSEPKP